MKYTAFDHSDGKQNMSSLIKKEIEESIKNSCDKGLPITSKNIRVEIISRLKSFGWPSSILVSKHSDISITSLKNETGICLQTGNMARMYADLIKLQTLYLDNIIKTAAILLPSSRLAKRLGSNIAQAERLINELQIFKKAYHAPTIIYALEETK